MRKQEILQTLTAHRENLNTFGVNRIGLVNANVKKNYSQSSEIDLVVDLKRHRNDFYNFMSLVAFLEKVLDHKINLILMQPRNPHLSSQVLNNTEFISIQKHSFPSTSAGLLTQEETHEIKQNKPGISKKE